MFVRLGIDPAVLVGDHHMALACRLGSDHERHPCHRPVIGIILQEIQAATLWCLKRLHLICSVIDSINPVDIGPYITIFIRIEMDSIHLVIQLVAVRGLGFLDQDGADGDSYYICQ